MDQSLPLVVWAVENASRPLAGIDLIKRLIVTYCREQETLAEKDTVVVNIPRFDSIWGPTIYISLPPLNRN